jgi:RHS repeat-associated protein
MTLTEYLNDPLNITGYSQVLKQTETDLKTGEVTITTYVIGHQRISQTVEKNGIKTEYYFTFDGHGSTRALTDFIGTIVELYSYDAFGNALGFDPANAKTEFLYSGEQFDSKIGQQYLRQRYYAPSTGRFNRLDPFFGDLNDPLSLHKYLYTHDNPVNGIDPNGLFGVVGSLGAFSASIQARTVNLTSTLNRGLAVTTNMYRAIIQASMLANQVQAMMDPKMYPAIAMATAYQTRMLAEFSRIPSNKLKSQILTKIFRIVAITTHYAAAYEVTSRLNYHIPIKPTGFPDFNDYLYRGFKPIVFINLTGSRRGDERAANAARLATSTPSGYTWHHHEVMGIMQLVRSDAHGLFFGGYIGQSHTGGVFYYTILKNISSYR